MKHIVQYQSPVGKILIVANDEALIGLYFDTQKQYFNILNQSYDEMSNKIILYTKKWLDNYFNKKIESFNEKICLSGSPFQMEVWNELRHIPYGQTITYGEIADKIAKKRNITKMSSRAIGHAIGQNPIAIIIPCHRVVGKNGKLTGYAAKLDIKKYLLDLEGDKQ